MSNFTFFAQNNEKDSYVKQACLLAMSIRATNRNSKICLIALTSAWQLGILLSEPLANVGLNGPYISLLLNIIKQLNPTYTFRFFIKIK